MEERREIPRAIYVFCLARSHSLEVLEGAAGLGPQSPLFLKEYRGITAVLSDVVVQDFCGAAGESHLQDLQWLAPRACRHEQIVEQVMRLSPVLPARFGTLFQSSASLEKSLAEHYEPITRFLDWVCDKQELGVKGLLDRDKARDWLFARALAEASQPLATSPGKRYFQEQRLRMQVEKQILEWLQTVAKQVLERLTPVSADRQACRLLPAHDTGPREEVFLNWAFLVSRQTVNTFCAHLDELNAEESSKGLTFVVTGPWPPYHFTPSLTAA